MKKSIHIRRGCVLLLCLILVTALLGCGAEKLDQAPGAGAAATVPDGPVCYLTISCSTILENMEDLTEGKEGLVPENGLIFPRTPIALSEGETVFTLLQKVTQDNKIHMAFHVVPMYDSAYIEGLGNLYEFDCGPNSGWMYCVNGVYPDYGVSKYDIQENDEIELNYTCDLGRDLGAEWNE